MRPLRIARPWTPSLLMTATQSRREWRSRRDSDTTPIAVHLDAIVDVPLFPQANAVESRRVIINRWGCLSGTNPDQVATRVPTPGETGFRRRLQAPRTKPDVDWLRYARRRYDPFLDVRDLSLASGV